MACLTAAWACQPAGPTQPAGVTNAPGIVSADHPVAGDGGTLSNPLDPGGWAARTSWPAFARGVAWDANWEDRTGWYGTDAAKRALDHLRSIHVDWIAVTPFSFQNNINEPAIRSRDWSDGIAADIAAAHARGMKVLVKPHIWSNQFWDGSGNWRGTIEMRNDDDWAAWFANYTAWIVACAREAARLKADAFCVGLEYLKSSRSQAARWREVVAAVRAVYTGPVTYAAHLDEIDLPFWDALDVIGINAYCPVAESNDPEHTTIRDAWRPHLDRFEEIATRTGIPIVFTEIGYASIDGAAKEPFRWPTGEDREDHAEQDACYRCFFDAVRNRPWFAGFFLWKYKITVETRDPSERHFVFQGKPAEATIKEALTSRFAFEG